MTFLELVQRLHQECGCSGSAPSTVVSQIGEAKRLVDWTAKAWEEVCQEYSTWSWNWLRGTFSFQTVTPVSTTATGTSGATTVVVADATGIAAGMGVTGLNIQPGTLVTLVNGTTITLSKALLGDITAASVTFYKDTYSATTIGLTDMAQWKPETFRIYLTSAGYGTETKLIYIPYQDWRDVYELGPRISGRPLNGTIKPDLTIAVGPYPNMAYTVSGDYIKTPTELAVDADTPDMPSQFHMAIVYLAMTYYARYEAAPEIYGDAEAKYQNVLRRIAANQLPELLYPPALA